MSEDTRPEQTRREDPADPSHAAREYATRDQLRAMAHPLRLDIMERVGRRGTARAADIAADLGIPANSVSYHLRILARGGVITEAPEAARDRRDRVWRLAQNSYEHGSEGRSINDPDVVDEDYVSASGAMALTAFDWMRSAWAAEMARHAALSSETPSRRGDGQMLATTLRLDHSQASELNRRISAIVDEYNQLNRDADGASVPNDPDSGDAARTFRVMYVLVADPYDEDPGSGS